MAAPQAIAAARKAHQPVSSVDPSLTAAVSADLAIVQQDKSSLATLRKTDFTGIKAAQKTLASDLVIYRKSLKHKA